MTDITLYDYWRSSASYRLRIALNLAGLEYRSVPVDLTKGAHKTPEHIALNPQGLVPVLEIDGHRFTQSLAILDYLDETRGLGLVPKEPVAAARLRALAHCVAVDVHPVCNLGPARFAAGFISDDIPEGMKTWMHRFIPPGLAAFETLLQGFDQAPFCAGDTPSLADICLMPQLYNARRWGVDFSDSPRILGVEAACTAHPAFAAAHPDQVNPG